ncbi:HAD family hydrolase [Brevibacillus borstelensis]|uniref:HAD family hydrolase n=1 Tax=Brevibacillus borstelensis TaxID=45462 RepID=UPI002E1E8E82|nr:HAD family hydrolase [Brevibacillus borstelensis]
MAIIFDLDQTLIESHSAKLHRRDRNWDVVYSMIPKLLPYEGIPELLQELSAKSIPFGIVTSSPASYCNRIVKHWGWKVHFTVCYHDTQRRKPHPDPINLGVTKLGVPKESVVSIGDDPKDILAARSAGVTSVGVLWGAKDPQGLIKTSPDYLFNTTEEMVNFLKRRYNF